MADPLINSIKLIVAVGSFAAKPDLLTGLKSGVSVVDTAKAMMAKAPRKLGSLTEDLTAGARVVFDGFRRDLPADAEQLFAQMVEATLPDATQIVADGMNPERIAASMIGRLSDPEHRRPPMPELLRTVTVPTLAGLMAEKTVTDALTPAFMAQVLGDLGDLRTGQDLTHQKLDEVLRRLGGAGQALSEPESLSLEDLRTLAVHFGGRKEGSKARLVEFLRLKADEFRAMRDELERLRARYPQLANRIAEARERLENGDAEAVRELVRDARQVLHDARLREALEQDADLVELDARALLALGRVELAFERLSAAADSFAAVDRLELARRWLRYQEILCTHGLRYGGPGMAFSERMIRRAIEDCPEEEQPALWAEAQNALAISLQSQGIRTGGEVSARLLAEAVAAYRAALRVNTEAAYPVAWAMTQNNLANALSEQGRRAGGEEGARLLAEAVAAYRAALRVNTEAAHPVDWATTQNNLANALSEQGRRAGGEEGARLLAEAVAVYRAALRVRSEAAHPEAWANTQNCLAVALYEHGRRTGGEDGAILLAEAVDAFRAALRVRTETAHPVDWAETQFNLALAEQALAANETVAAPRAHLKSALGHVEAALRVFDPEHMPYHHERANRLREEIVAALAAGEDG